jgi:hypothetical protein
MTNPTVTVVRAAACHLCEDAQDALSEAVQQWPIRIEVVDADSAPGMDLVARHCPASVPLILIDGQFFSQGRLPRAKLRALLGARWAVSSR